jgi:quercetin dioxygenase-like cupin family protein
MNRAAESCDLPPPPSSMKGTVMNHPTPRRRFLKQAGALTLVTPRVLRAADAPVPSPVPTLVRTRDLLEREPNRSPNSGKVWRLHQSATSRTNLVEMRGEGGEHIHPDAEHSLYVIRGEVIATVGQEKFTLRAGDYISIPAGLTHGYSVPTDQSALLISMDAPPYDPQKTIRSKKSVK